MINGMPLLWYLLAAGSLVFLIWGLYHNNSAMWVMKLAWVLIVLYTGPIGLFVYLLSCRQPMPGMHHQFINSHWKQSVGSLMHCVAGDATGIIHAAAVVDYNNFCCAEAVNLFYLNPVFFRYNYKISGCCSTNLN